MAAWCPQCAITPADLLWAHPRLCNNWGGPRGDGLFVARARPTGVSSDAGARLPADPGDGIVSGGVDHRRQSVGRRAVRVCRSACQVLIDTVRLSPWANRLRTG